MNSAAADSRAAWIEWPVRNSKALDEDDDGDDDDDVGGEGEGCEDDSGDDKTASERRDEERKRCTMNATRSPH